MLNGLQNSRPGTFLKDASEVEEILLHRFLFKFAEGLIAIFIPFYILEAGFPVTSVFYFFLIYYGMSIVAPYPFGLLSSKIGYKHISLLSSVFILGFYVILRAADVSNILYLSAVIGGLGFNLYWAGMNPEFAEGSDKEETESEAGLFFSMPALAAIISPLTGGLILFYGTFNHLFGSAAVLMFSSFVPLFFTLEHRDGMDVNLKEFFKGLKLNEVLTYSFEGAHSVGEKIVWPIYLAILIGGSLKIGGAGTLIAAGGAITSYTVGKYMNEKTRPKILVSGAILAAVTLILMSQVTTTFQALVISSFHGLTYTLVNLPIFTKASRKAQEKDLIEYFMMRQIFFGIGKVTVITVTLFIFLNYRPVFFEYSLSFIAACILLTGYFGSKID